jgi:hypothetical protein
MSDVDELSAPYSNFMVSPRRGPEVCRECFNLTSGYGRCYACARGGQRLDAMVPISYSASGGQLHHALVAYKRLLGAGARHFELGLGAVMWRYLAAHETCLARSAGVPAFTLVTVVPSSTRIDDASHPLHRIVSELVGPVRDRYEPLLHRSDADVTVHQFNADRYAARRQLTGEAVLLIDDTWTTGANAHSAAAALKDAGAGLVGALVIGRYVTRDWHHNDKQLRSLPRPFDWASCALCAGAEGQSVAA